MFKITGAIVKPDANRKLRMEISYEGDIPYPDVFDQKECFYFAEKDGVVRYYSYRGPGNTGGFGGAVIDIKMSNGEEKVLQGPWSSRCGVMNMLGFTPSIEVSFKGHRSRPSAITIKFAEQIMRQFNIPFKLVAENDDSDVDYKYKPI